MISLPGAFRGDDPRSRDYNPGAGRFTTRDPLETPPGEPTVGNPYPYAVNDPLNKIDPLGLSPVKDKDLRGSGAIYGPPAPQHAKATEKPRYTYGPVDYGKATEKSRSFEFSARPGYGQVTIGLFIPDHVAFVEA